MAVTATEKRLLVGGEWVETGDWIDVRSPYSGETVGRVAKAGADETRRAIDAAAEAMRDPLPAHRRAEILVKVAGAIGRRHEELAQTICAEAGKPLKAARMEASRAMSTYTFAAVEARKLSGEVIPMDASQAGEGKLAFTLRVPRGVVGAISPFNFPLNLVAHKIAPALAAGCAVVLKPATATPLSALLLAELEADAGLPPGWLNVVVGPSSEIGDVLVDDERVAALTFTGSGEVGWKLKERAPRKHVALELGNATPVIVCCNFPPFTVDRIAANAFSFAGQSCISIQRVYVLDGAWDDFVPALIPKIEALKVGDPADENTDVGPLIDEAARERVLAWIAESKGDVLTGGELSEDGLLRPTVIASPDPTDKVQCEEVFGPVVTLTRVRDLDEAIELANATACRRASSRATSTPLCRRRSDSSSAASP
jgi:acyl-CoA reductase-like NAD-dependent aldehyde dehydrogenase